jgi:RNA polymerase sigma factor FliA
MINTHVANRSVHDDEERVLWEKFLAGRDPALRAKLIQRYLGTVQHIAASLFARRPREELEFADYLQYGRVGLIESVDRFDPAHGAAFTTYAGYRIRGAILNGIERSTEMTAQGSYRASVRKDRVESAREIARTNERPDPFESMVDVAIDLALGYLLEDSGVSGEEALTHTNDPYRVCELKFLEERLRLIVEVLPERERFIIKGHYYDHIDFHLLANMLGISKGRVSQLHARGIRLLREANRSLEQLDITF